MKKYNHLYNFVAETNERKIKGTIYIPNGNRSRFDAFEKVFREKNEEIIEKVDKIKKVTK